MFILIMRKNMNHYILKSVFVLLIILPLSIQSQAQALPLGVKEIVVHKRDSSSKKAFLRDYITFHLEIRNWQDSLLQSTYDDKPIIKYINEYQSVDEYEYQNRGYLYDILRISYLGDSITYIIDSNDYFKFINRPRPDFVPEGTDLNFTISIINIETEAKRKKAVEVKEYDQLQVDLELMRAYVRANNLRTRKASSGLWIAYLDEATVDETIERSLPEEGNLVRVNYKGMLLDGTVFSSSDWDGEPLEFPVGQKVMIEGIEQGITLIEEGRPAILLIPSGLAYGESGVPDQIPPNTPIAFEIEIVEISNYNIIIAEPGELDNSEDVVVENNDIQNPENNAEDFVFENQSDIDKYNEQYIKDLRKQQKKQIKEIKKRNRKLKNR